MVFCTIFTALDLIRVVISFRISVRFLVCWLGGCPVTVSAFRSASSILIRDPKCLPKSLGAPTGAPRKLLSLGYFPARPAALGEANRRRSLLQVLLRSHPGRKPSFYLPFVGLAFGFLFPGSGIFTCANRATASLKLRG